MPNSCCVFGCSNRANRDLDIRYFRIPTIVNHKGPHVLEFSKKRRDKWIKNLSLCSKGIESPHARVCSDHFVKGYPSKLYEEDDVDWAPTLNLGHHKLKVLSEADLSRKERVQQRDSKKRRLECATTLLALQTEVTATKQVENNSISPIEDSETTRDNAHADNAHADNDHADNTKSCQTDLEGTHVVELKTWNLQLRAQTQDLRAELDSCKLTMTCMEQDTQKVKFYTGLPNFPVLLQVFNLISPYMSDRNRSTLTKFQKFLMVIMRLRLNLPLQDLAYRFGISVSTASRIWHKVLPIMYCRLKFLIVWPDRDVLKTTMPIDFRVVFKDKVAVIIDCFEVFLERPSNLMSRAQTWSNYKHHNTVKFLIGITPSGIISYISKAWGGRASDKMITEECGILKKLLPGDTILADRGFNIQESVGLYCASIAIPAFTRGKSQLSPFEVEDTRKLANLRIHVERVIGLVRRKYNILQSHALPLEYMVKRDGDSATCIDMIGVICCALTNLSESVVPLD